MTPDRVYKSQLVYPVAGIFIILFGLFLASFPLSHVFAGTQYLVGGGKGQQGHLATRSELIRDGLLALMVCPLGIGFIVLYFNASVTMDSDGIVVNGILRQTKFRSTYDRVKSVGAIERGNKELFFRVVGNGASVRISNTYAQFEQMREDLIERVGAAHNSVP